MKTVTVHKAKSTLSQLIADVEAGEEVVIMRGKDPVVRLVPVHQQAPKRAFGALKGQVVVSATFFDPLPAEELVGWEG
ncbi:MAG: type II toxin-antitoxin system Phd/YefM family antitoxin [Gemmatimonadaceae bacterium]|nr:type II toxin-antitoxin system Phd/YefM family antitoxin [Gemmatimonadaceae bacterium]